jgi:hypothetical protein
LAALPPKVRQQARDAYLLFQQNPRHPGLHFKRVHDDPPVYSARVGIGYRAVGACKGTIIIWYWIGSHSDYDRLVAQL